MKCQFGRDAQNGDYVLTLHQYGYNGKNSVVLAGRVWNDKVYTGWKPADGLVHKTDIHKTSAILVIDPMILSKTQKDNIEADMCECIKGYGEVKETLTRYLAKTYFDHIDKVWHAFELCADESDVETVIDRLTYGYGGKFGIFEYTVSDDGTFFTVVNFYNDENGDSQTDTNDIDFYGQDDDE